jgi:hypothetical protein
MTGYSHSTILLIFIGGLWCIFLTACSISGDDKIGTEYDGSMHHKIVLYNPEPNTIIDTTYRQLISVINDNKDSILISFDGRMHYYKINMENIYSEQFASGSGRMFRFSKDSLYFNEGVTYSGVSSWRQTVEWNFSGKKK